MRRIIALLAVSFALVAGALPGHAAPKSAKLWFGNAGDCGTGTPAYTLAPKAMDGTECSGTILAVGGSGLILDQTYLSARASKFKVDVARPITGTVHITHVPAVGVPVTLPGYATVDFTVKLDSKKIGSFTATGVIAPAGSLAHKFSVKIPASFRGMTARKLTIVAEFQDAVGLTTISYSGATASFVTVPTR